MNEIKLTERRARFVYNGARIDGFMMAIETIINNK